MRVLIADDDRAVREALRRALILSGYDVTEAGDGGAALEQIQADRPDAVVLDIGMPEVDGLEVCRRLRAAGDRTPVLMLTARDAVADRIEGLDVGADDYVVKPFDIGEVRARLRALLRRSVDLDDAAQSEPRLVFGEVHLDPHRHGVIVGDRFVELSRTEYSLLELFMRNPRRVLPHDLIYERVWEYDFGATSNTLRVYVGYLRRKLQAAGAPELLHNVRGVGYVLREP